MKHYIISKKSKTPFKHVEKMIFLNNNKRLKQINLGKIPNRHNNVDINIYNYVITNTL